MIKQNNLQSLFCGIIFCISIAALIIACLVLTKKGGEYYNVTDDVPNKVKVAYYGHAS